jgi:hypothetical protein
MLLDSKLRASPVSPLRVVSNAVVSSKANPLRKRSVLVRFLGESTLGTEGLVGRHGVDQREMAKRKKERGRKTKPNKHGQK